ncbi:MAG TPA: hypothetical protein QGF02_03165 [Candidatus Babeliales bacterium]|nr:hypothetical protein [Candidatus Babeliales bacterium]
MDRMLHESRCELSSKSKSVTDNFYTITTSKKKHHLLNQKLSWITVMVSWDQYGTTRKVQLSSAG